MDNDPWIGIELSSPTSLNVRLCLESYPFEVFRGLDSYGRRMFFLIHDRRLLSSNALPKMEGLFVTQIIREDNKGMLGLTLEDQNNSEIFSKFCSDLLITIAQADNENDAVKAFINRAWEWHALLRRANSVKLSYEAQLGLIGELYSLQIDLAKCVGLRKAVIAWRGPEKTPKDFELEGLCIETKARGSASKDCVRISSEHQLAEVPGANLMLLVHTFTTASEQKNNVKLELHSVISKILEAIKIECADVETLFVKKIEEVGYREEHEYELAVCHQSTIPYLVEDDFPRIIPGKYPSELSQISYDLSLSSVEHYKISYDQLVKRLKGMNSEND